MRIGAPGRTDSGGRPHPVAAAPYCAACRTILMTGEGSGLRAIALAPDGKLVLGGDTFARPTGWDFALLRLH